LLRSERSDYNTRRPLFKTKLTTITIVIGPRQRSVFLFDALIKLNTFSDLNPYPSTKVTVETVKKLVEKGSVWVKFLA
jgi:hypothetical protein